MNDQLFIPNKIKVGYQKRDDTYTKQLAYVTYFDNKGVLRKQGSWDGWRDHDIEPNEYENKPIEGFVLNKGVGGVKSGWSRWDTRTEKVRVYDPRNFEIEITIPNLLYILQEATSTKGKGLEGQFVYAWSGKDLMLVPVESGAYKNSQEYTTLQAGKVGAKELVPGCVYLTKTQRTLIYLGKFPWYTWNYINPHRHWSDNDDRMHLTSEKLHIFLDDAKEHVNSYSSKYLTLKNSSSLAKRISNEPVSNYAELMEKYNDEVFHASKLVGFELIPKKLEITRDENHRYYSEAYKLNANFFAHKTDWGYTFYTIQERYGSYPDYKFLGFEFQPESRTISNEFIAGYMNTHRSSGSIFDRFGKLITTVKERKLFSKEELLEMEFHELFFVMENGRKHKFKIY